MELTLCYKTYEAKMSLASMRSFKESTGLDMWHSLISFIECFDQNKTDSVLSRMNKLYKVMPFDVAARLFHSLIKHEMDSIPLIDIEDAMFRTGWLPTSHDHDKSEPWPLVMYQLAMGINAQFYEEQTAKKSQADT